MSIPSTVSEAYGERLHSTMAALSIFEIVRVEAMWQTVCQGACLLR